MIMARAYDLMGLIHSGEISDGDLELGAKFYREHLKEHGSQLAEEKLIDDKHKEDEDKRRNVRRIANQKKDAVRADAEAATLVIIASEISDCVITWDDELLNST